MLGMACMLQVHLQNLGHVIMFIKIDVLLKINYKDRC